MKVTTVPFHTNGIQPVTSVRMIGEKSCYLGIGPGTEIFDLVIHFKDLESVIALGNDIVAAAAIAVQTNVGPAKEGSKISLTAHLASERRFTSNSQ